LFSQIKEKEQKKRILTSACGFSCALIIATK